MIRILINRAGRSSFAEEKNVGGHKCEDACGDKENMGHKKSRDGKRTHLRATTHQALDALSDPGNFAGRVGSHSSGKIGSLIPGQQVTSESHRQHQTEEHASREPKELAASFV